MIPKSSLKRNLYGLTVAVSVIGLGLLYWLTPLQADDFWYMMTSSSAATKIDAFKCVWEESLRHLNFDTGRLSNIMVAPFLTILPRWIFALLCCCALIGVIHYGRHLADAPMTSMRAVLLVVGIVLALPWVDFMFSVVFALNYLWTSALVLLAISLMLRIDGRPHPKHGEEALLMVICVLAGWMHEGFAMPTLAGVICYYLTLRRQPDIVRVGYISAFGLGALLIASAPAMWVRIGGGEYGFGRLTLWEGMASGAVFNSLYYLFMAASVWFVTKHREITAEQRARLVFLIVATSVSTILFTLFYSGPRMGWYGQLFSGIGLLYIGSLTRFSLKRSVWVALWCVATAVITINLVCSVVWQCRLSDEAAQIRELYKSAGPDGQVFYDAIPERIDACLMKPSFRQFNEESPMEQFSYYYGPDKANLTLLPTSLAEVDTTRCEPTSSARAVIYRGEILLTDTLEAPRVVTLTLKSGDKIDTRVSARKFTDRNSRHYTLIKPHYRVVSPDAAIADIDIAHSAR